jgi:hypothetical protein
MPKKQGKSLLRTVSNAPTVPLAVVGKFYDQVVKKVSGKKETDSKNIILYVGTVYNHMLDALDLYEKDKKQKFRIGLIHDSRQKLDQYTEKALERLDIVISCDTNSPIAIQKALLPYQQDILVLTCRSEKHIPVLSRISPNLPYVDAPTSESLNWASDKIAMRNRLATYNKDISPKFAVVEDTKTATIKRIEEEVGYPMVVKPSGLAASVLVTICYHKEELEQALDKIFKKIAGIYKKRNFQLEPQVLVEQFMEGEMYSVDAYVSPHGKIFFCPMVYIRTGKHIGFDDFFGYFQVTPTLLNPESIKEAKIAATQAIMALGLKSTTAHVEMMKTEQGWKIIEAGARVGGFRHMLYEFSYGINHTANDVAIRRPERPVLYKKIKGYTAAMKFYAKHEGKLTALIGIKKAQELKSFKRLYINKKIGDTCKFAKNGGVSVFNIILHNNDRSKLLADVRRLETMIKIETN